MRSSTNFSSFPAALTALLLAACGGNIAQGVGAPFSETWQNDQGKSIAALEERLRAAKAPAATPVAVGVNDTGLFGSALPSGKRWQHAGTADTVPIVAGDVVVASNDG